MARILVIEDNPANLELMTYLLTAFGHSPLEATNGTSGLAAVRHARPDLIVCDVHLPDIDGYAIAQQLKADPSTRALPLVAVTALAMVGDREQILAAGFDGYLAKPIIPETFIAQVEAFLDPALRATPLPYAAPDAAPAPPARTPAQRARILVVDDAPVNQELMRNVLEPFGYTVAIAGSVSQALGLLRDSPPDLVFSDLHMPIRDGFDLIRAIMADPLLRQIKIIIHSATIMSEHDRREALRLGAARFISRPIEPQLILEEIEACLHAQPEQQDGNYSRP